MYPKYSVLMSVYKNEKPEYLRKSLESIFCQSVVADEIIMVIDGPITIGLQEVLNEYSLRNSGLVLVELKNNIGLGGALNEGLKYCRNELIARMDTDDIAHLDRFKIQLEAFIDNPDVDLIGGQILEFSDENYCRKTMRTVPQSQSEIDNFIKLRNPFNHMTVMFNKNKVLSAGGYKDMIYFEDYYLWIRMKADGCKWMNVSDVLVYVRTNQDFYIRRGGKNYIKPIINFQKTLLESGNISKVTYFKNIVIRSTIAILPVKIRGMIYGKVLRK